jgi:hypothetical protein
MPDAANKTLALTDGAVTFYLLQGETGYGGKSTLRTDAGPLTFARKGVAYNTGWWRADGSPQTVTISQPGPRTKVGYQLRNPDAESAAYPLRLDVGDERISGLDDDTFAALYNTEYEPGPVHVTTVGLEGMTVIEDGVGLPPEDGLTWVANAFDELRRHPELLHLFPGHLHGFRDAVKETLNSLPFLRGRGLDAGAYEKDGYLIAHASTPYEPHHTRVVYGVGRNGQQLRKGRTVTETKSLRVSFRVPNTIAGNTRAEAVRSWHQALATIVEDVTLALTPAPCWHCDGTGIVSAKAVAAGSTR